MAEDHLERLIESHLQHLTLVTTVVRMDLRRSDRPSRLRTEVFEMSKLLPSLAENVWCTHIGHEGSRLPISCTSGITLHCQRITVLRAGMIKCAAS